MATAVKAVNKAAEDRNPLAHEALIGDVKSRGEKGSAYHIQTVNGFHGHLKTWMTRFNGVAAKVSPKLCRMAQASNLPREPIKTMLKRLSSALSIPYQQTHS